MELIRGILNVPALDKEIRALARDVGLRPTPTAVIIRQFWEGVRRYPFRRQTCGSLDAGWSVSYGWNSFCFPS
jgi:hypothetical protein